MTTSLKRKSEDLDTGKSKTCLLSKKLSNDFFNQPCEDLAKGLLGKILVRQIDEDTILKGRIVETECYLGGEDKASHSHDEKRTDRNEPMYMKPGTAYVYITYGMYFCFNISSQGAGAAVLLRALEPIEGLEYMHRERGKFKRKREIKRDTALCDGPSKLCISFNITKDLFNKTDLCTNDTMWIEDDDDDSEKDIVITSRIGISSAGEEWGNKPLRFYILGNESVSKRDKVVEKFISDRLNTT